MPLAKITGQGLLAIGFSVALLWSCFLSEQVTMQRAIAERTRVLHEIENLQKSQHPIPVTAPMPASVRRFQVTVG